MAIFNSYVKLPEGKDIFLGEVSHRQHEPVLFSSSGWSYGHPFSQEKYMEHSGQLSFLTIKYMENPNFQWGKMG